MSFSNPVVSEGLSLDSVSVFKASDLPWSYNIYGDQNCQGNFYSESLFKLGDGLNTWAVNWTVNSIHTSIGYHVKIMDAPSSIQIDGDYYRMYYRDLNNEQ